MTNADLASPSGAGLPNMTDPPPPGFVLLSPTGLHVGLLLPSILDRPKACIPKAAWRRDAVSGIGIHQEHLGAGHLFRQ
jgi:hypothetical protein